MLLAARTHSDSIAQNSEREKRERAMANPESVAQDLIFHAPDQFRCALDGQLMMDPVRTPQAWLKGSCMTRTVPEAPGLQYG